MTDWQVQLMGWATLLGGLVVAWAFLRVLWALITLPRRWLRRRRRDRRPYGRRRPLPVSPGPGPHRP